jgi:hypothetical protein
VLRLGRKLIYTGWVRHASKTICSAAAMLLAGCSDANVRVCFGSSSFCEQALLANTAPVADAGGPSEALPGNVVRLDGSGSMDSDGHIDSYSWAQIDGRTVVLRNADRVIAEFDAPPVTETQTLTFQLTVVDDGRLADRDETTVTIQPPATAATARGVRLLEHVVLPAPLLTQAPCALVKKPSAAGRAAFAGLWLAVHASRLARPGAGDNAAVSRYLDGARILVTDPDLFDTDPDEIPPFRHHGLSALAAFSTGRDPALADRARQLLIQNGPTGATRRLLAGGLVVSLADDSSIQFREVQPGQARAIAIEQLLEQTCELPVDPVALAAHMLVLLSPEQ